MPAVSPEWGQRLTDGFDRSHPDLLLLVRDDLDQRLQEHRRPVEVGRHRQGPAKKFDAFAADLFHVGEIVRKNRTDDRQNLFEVKFEMFDLLVSVGQDGFFDQLGVDPGQDESDFLGRLLEGLAIAGIHYLEKKPIKSKACDVKRQG